MIKQTTEFTTIEEVVTAHTCDFCQLARKSQTTFENAGIGWEPLCVPNVSVKTAIHMEEIFDTYPSGERVSSTTFHACPTCMKDVVFPALSKIALNEPTVEEWYD